MNPSLSVFGWLDTLKFNRFHRQLVIVGSLICALAGYNSQIIAYIVPLALEEWQLTPLEAGTMIPYGFLGLMFGAAGFGMVADRLGRKKTTMLVVLVLCVFNAAAAFAPSLQDCSMGYDSASMGTAKLKWPISRVTWMGPAF